MGNPGSSVTRALVLAAALGGGALAAAEGVSVVQEQIAQELAIEPVWAGHSVGFCLLTRPPLQYVAYYDAQRQMTVAQRRLDQSTWTVQKLPSRLGWDIGLFRLETRPAAP
jgi:hypothetical protein